MVTGKNEYVTHGMKAKCSCGAADFCQYLNVKTDHGVFFHTADGPLMNANDHVSEQKENISPFGRCHSPSNPHGKLLEAVFASLFPFGTLIMSISQNFFNYSIMGVPCTPITPFPWRQCDDNYLIDGAPALTKESVLTCVYGGFITITDDPKDAEKKDSSEENKEDAYTPVTAQDKRDNLTSDITGKMNSFIDTSQVSEGQRGNDAVAAYQEATSNSAKRAAYEAAEQQNQNLEMFDEYPTGIHVDC